MVSRCEPCEIGLCRSTVAHAAVIRSSANQDISCFPSSRSTTAWERCIGLVIYLVLDFCLHLPIWLVLTLTITPNTHFLTFGSLAIRKRCFWPSIFSLIRTTVETMMAIARIESPAPPPKTPDLEPIDRS